MQRNFGTAHASNTGFDSAYIDPVASRQVWISGCFVVFYFFFLLLGTLFYGYYDDFGPAQGFYYAVSVGLCVGFSYSQTEDMYSMLFSDIYQSVGLLAFVTLVLFLYNEIVEFTRDKWFANYVKRQLEQRKSKHSLGILEFYNANMHITNLTILILLLLIGFTAFVCIYFGWNVIEGLYFCIGCFTGTGLLVIDANSPDSVYIAVGVYTAVGITAVAVFLLYIAEQLMAPDYQAMVESAFNDEVKLAELKVLRELAISKDSLTPADGTDPDELSMDRNEFAMLTIARMHLIDFSLIQQIYEEFDAKDTAKKGVLKVSNLRLSRARRGSSLGNKNSEIGNNSVFA